MRTRLPALAVALGMIVTACGGAAGETTTSTTSPATTTSTEAAGPEAVVLSYSLEPGTSFTYEVGMDQHIELTATGDASALSEEEVPGEMSLDMTGTTTLTQSVAAGPEPGTYEVTITADFSDLVIDGTIDGEPFDPADIPEMAAMEPINVTVIVDEQGNIIPSDDEFGDLFGDLGGLEAFGDFGTAGADLGRFIGPPFSDREVTVGDTWSETVETPLFMEGEVFTTQVDNTVTGTDTVDGFDVFVIDTTTTTSAFEFDLGEFFIGLFEAFVPEDATEEELAELELIKESLKFFFSVDESVSQMKTWFDAEAGLARRAELDGGTTFTMDINMPDETTGELIAFGMMMSVDQTVTYRLVDSGNA